MIFYSYLQNISYSNEILKNYCSEFKKILKEKSKVNLPDLSMLKGIQKSPSSPSYVA